MRLSLPFALLFELLSKRTLPREPEPELVMDDEAQVAAYIEAGKIDGIMSASYLFQSARISQVIQNCKEVLDLGCGPAVQLGQIAQLNPEISFHGVDLSETMLQKGNEYINELKLTNVRFSRGDITNLSFIPSYSVDAVISTMALHHLPTLEHLRSCFKEIRRVLRPGGAIYLVDFGRLKTLKSVIYFAYMNVRYQPHLFSLDYERSLRAAFLYEDFKSLLSELPNNPQILSTAPVPLLVVIKTADFLPETLKERLQAPYHALQSRYRDDLNSIRLIFQLGGMVNDPF